MQQDEHFLRWVVTPLLLLTLLVSVMSLHTSMKVGEILANLTPQEPARTCLPLPSIPLTLVREDPQCAQKVLTIMNVTNVRVLEPNASLPAMSAAMEKRLRRLGWNRSQARFTGIS